MALSEFLVLPPVSIKDFSFTPSFDFMATLNSSGLKCAGSLVYVDVKIKTYHVTQLSIMLYIL